MELTFSQVRDELRRVGVTIKRTTVQGEFKVNYQYGPEASAYYTEDLDDAFRTGLVMSKRRVP